MQWFSIRPPWRTLELTVNVPRYMVSVPNSEHNVPMSEANVPTSKHNVPMSEANVPTSKHNVPMFEVNVPTSECYVPMSEVNVPAFDKNVLFMADACAINSSYKLKLPENIRMSANFILFYVCFWC
jgi:hypothetical protein